MRKILIRMEAKTFQAGGRHEQGLTGGKCQAGHRECVTEVTGEGGLWLGLHKPRGDGQRPWE